MNKRLLFILVLSFTAFVSASAQERRTVTNDDLEKFRQKRLAAERDLRENYQRLGFPSPEELEKQIEQSSRERSELAARLRAENLEREQLELQRRRAENEARSFNLQIQNYGAGADDNFYNYPWTGGGFFSFPNFGFPNNRFNRFNRGGFGGGRRNFGNQPRVEYRNNVPVIVQPPGRRIAAPNAGGKRN